MTASAEAQHRERHGPHIASNLSGSRQPQARTGRTPPRRRSQPESEHSGGPSLKYPSSVAQYANTASSSQSNDDRSGHEFIEARFNGPVQFKSASGQQKDRDMRQLEILRRLNVCPYRDRKDRNPDRVPGTCNWFISHELFRSWEEHKSSSMLWVSADPGCGKSVLAKYLVDSILRTTESRTLCYFFFKDDFEDQKNATTALCSVLCQLFMQKRILLSDELLDKFDIIGEKIAGSFGELWETLINAAEDESAGEIICLLNAFDECEQHGRSQLATALCRLYGAQSTRIKANLKFLLTSRPYDGIRRGFQPIKIPGLPVIHLKGESDMEMSKISQEIDVFIKFRAHDIGTTLELTSEEEDLLLQRLMRVPNRTYLWVYLTLDLIQSDVDINKTRIIEATSQLPKTVDEAYDRILSKSPDIEKAKKVLNIISAAARPLTLKEMIFAMDICENHRSYKDMNLERQKRFHQNIRDICGLFVTVIDSRIYLLHQTAREFLVQVDTANSINDTHTSLQWKYSINLQESHGILTRICIWHLLFAEFETQPPGRDETLSQYVKAHVFLDYSAKHWAAHFRQSSTETQNAMRDSTLKICDIGSCRCLTWFKVYWTSTDTVPKGFTTLMIASYFGVRTVVELLLETGTVDLNSCDDTYGLSTLSWAAGNGFSDIIKLLIKSPILNKFKRLFKKGVEINSVDKYGRTPLAYAVWSGNVAVVEQLIKAGAWVDLEDKIGGTPLSYAVCNGHDQIIKALLKTGTRVDSEDKEIRKKLLLSAAQKGHAAVVKLLLDTGKVDVNTADGFGQTPLSRAAEGGNKAVIELLLEHRADVDTKDHSGRTPLSRAAGRGHKAIAMLLLEHKADVDTKDKYGRTLLSWAAEEGHKAVVQLLLEHRPDVDTKDRNGRTVLSHAAGGGRHAVVKLLLEQSADLDITDHDGRTPLSWAVKGSHETVARLLLQHRAEVDAKDKDGQTPLLWAAERGPYAVVKLLLEHGADVDVKDKHGRTPLSWAAERSLKATGDPPFVRNPDIEITDMLDQRVPFWTPGRGPDAVVRLLLLHGANINTKDRCGQTPLSRAVKSGNKEVVKLLR
jgi:ankyrin repeat domain-containing protein 50